MSSDFKFALFSPRLSLAHSLAHLLIPLVRRHKRTSQALSSNVYNNCLASRIKQFVFSPFFSVCASHLSMPFPLPSLLFSLPSQHYVRQATTQMYASSLLRC